MKLSYEAHGTKVTIETSHDEVTISEVGELIEQLLLGAGFHPDTIEGYFGKE